MKKMHIPPSLSVSSLSLFLLFFLKNVTVKKGGKRKKKKNKREKTPRHTKFVPRWMLKSRGKRSSTQVFWLPPLPLLHLWNQANTKPSGPWEFLAELQLLALQQGVAEPGDNTHWKHADNMESGFCKCPPPALLLLPGGWRAEVGRHRADATTHYKLFVTWFPPGSPP